ncbi:MAG TPA: hypothetical protein VG871_24375 [Vicinamibacterales bacterium]|nr:hypothetical protein [Vicinamibacterales bacterium]
MKKHLAVVAIALVTALGADRVNAQQPAPKPAPDFLAEEAARLAAEQAAVVPLEVTVVVSRYEGDKKVSSQPYVLNVNATPNRVVQQSPMTIVKIGSQVPVPNFAPVGSDGKPVVGGGPLVFKEIGTQIDCRARPLPDGRFELMLGVQETNVSPAGQSGTRETANVPVLRTFQTTNNLILRDGQSRQFAAATDPVNGQLVKIEVSVKVEK